MSSSGHMRNLVLATVATACVAAAGPGERKVETDMPPKEKLHVYLLIGQSNMAGRAPIPEDAKGPLPRCFLLDSKDAWEPAANPLNRHSTIRKGLDMQKLGPGYAFALKMLEGDESISLGLVVNARGGTKIGEWRKGGKYYDEAVRRAKSAAATGTLKGILWHQGESDAANAGYLEDLKALIADLRSDLGDDRLPFVAGQVINSPLVNKQVAALPMAVPFAGCASAEGLKATDGLHFDGEGVRILGQRYAEEMQRLQK